MSLSDKSISVETVSLMSSPGGQRDEFLSPLCDCTGRGPLQAGV